MSLNSTQAINKQGVVSLTTTGSAVIVLGNVFFDGIVLSVSTNGAFSLSGVAQSLSISGSTFRGIKTGNAGGAIYLNVSSYSIAYADITNSVCCCCC
jgi:hypothetical protein